jgi:hypothetical protein
MRYSFQLGLAASFDHELELCTNRLACIRTQELDSSLLPNGLKEEIVKGAWVPRGPTLFSRSRSWVLQLQSIAVFATGISLKY